MRRKFVILAAAASIAGSIFGTAVPVSAAGPPGKCPDGYTARPVTPGDEIDQKVDRNGNGVVCEKPIPSQGGGSSTGTLEIDDVAHN